MGKDWLRVAEGRSETELWGAALYSPTEATREVNVMTGVKKAFQRARRRSCLTSAKLLFVGGYPYLHLSMRQLTLLSLPIRVAHRSPSDAGLFKKLLVKRGEFDYKNIMPS